jgi:SAM-dependent methyltransferase
MNSSFLGNLRSGIGRTTAQMHRHFYALRSWHRGRGAGAATIPALGYLDEVAIEDGALRLHGWTATFDSGTVDGFRISCDGEELSCEKQEIGIASPDVHAVHPHLSGSAHCRFTVWARLDSMRKSRTALVTCTPLFQRRAGRMMVRLVDPIIPMPGDEDIRIVGEGDFLETSCEWLTYFIQEVGLRSESDVLDVGCGCGRIAYALAHYLQPTACYEGFDIIDRLVTSAQQTISPIFPNFRFQKVDIYNSFYNPTGLVRSLDFNFPYDDESFDFIVLLSVFTHMLPPDVRHYLGEIHRVLRPGGKCLSSCFLLNAESRRLIRQGRSTIALVHPLNECFVAVPKVPEDAIGFEEQRLLDWIAERNFLLQGKYYGSWCGRPKFNSYQDILIYQKVAAQRQFQKTA